MDIASLIGVLSGLGMIAGAIIYQADVTDFINLPGMMVVFGGTISATLLTFHIEDVIEAFKAFFTVFFHSRQDPNDMLDRMIAISRHAHKDGFLSLQKLTGDKQPKMVNKVLQLASDNMNEDVIGSALRTEIESVTSRSMVIQEIFRKMAVYAPAFGMMGTIIGLISMLSNMEDPSQIGPAMALALTTTFYGTFLSTMVFSPAAGKLESHMALSVINLEIVYSGAISIMHRESPMILYERAGAFIPADKRREFKIHE